MTPMFATLNVLAPMFVILGFGFTAGYAKSFRERAGGLNQFVFFISLPCFVYVAITTAELPDTLPWQVWVLAFFLPAVAFALHRSGSRHRGIPVSFRSEQRLCHSNTPKFWVFY